MLKTYRRNNLFHGYLKGKKGTTSDEIKKYHTSISICPNTEVEILHVPQNRRGEYNISSNEEQSTKKSNTCS